MSRPLNFNKPMRLRISHQGVVRYLELEPQTVDHTGQMVRAKLAPSAWRWYQSVQSPAARTAPGVPQVEFDIHGNVTFLWDDYQHILRRSCVVQWEPVKLTEDPNCPKIFEVEYFGTSWRGPATVGRPTSDGWIIGVPTEARRFMKDAIDGESAKVPPYDIYFDHYGAAIDLITGNHWPEFTFSLRDDTDWIARELMTGISAEMLAQSLETHELWGLI